MDEATQDHEFQYRIRPRFHVETKYTTEQLKQKIDAQLHAENALITGWVDAHYAKLSIPHANQHYWSPFLSLSFEEIEEGTMIRGRYGPRQTVWTMFVFFYAFIGFAVMIVLILGTSYLSLGKSGAILWLVPVLVLVFLTLYLVSFFGQKLGHDQMVTLHHFIEKCLGQEIKDE